MFQIYYIIKIVVLYIIVYQYVKSSVFSFMYIFCYLDCFYISFIYLFFQKERNAHIFLDVSASLQVMKQHSMLLH